MKIAACGMAALALGCAGSPFSYLRTAAAETASRIVISDNPAGGIVATRFGHGIRSALRAALNYGARDSAINTPIP
jgi:methylmalonyl-CoA mutase cobalamin-binding subunit